MSEIREKGEYKLIYRLMFEGKPRNVTLKIMPLKENGMDKLFASVRIWRDRC